MISCPRPPSSKWTSKMPRKQRPQPFDPDAVRDVSVAVYKSRLGADDTRRMLEKDADDGTMLRERARAYDALTRCYLTILTARMTGADNPVAQDQL